MVDATKVRGMLDVIKSGTAFKNPYSVIDATLSNRNLAIKDSNGTDLVRVIVPDLGDASPIVIMYKKVIDLVAHTNRLSGVDLYTAPNIVTLSKTAQAARDINEEKNGETINAIFGSILNSYGMIALVTTLTYNLKAYIAGSMTLAAMNTLATSYTTSISAQITADVDAFTKAQRLLIQFSVASNLVSLDGDKDTKKVIDAVSSNPLKVEISKSVIEQKKKVTTSIYES